MDSRIRTPEAGIRWAMGTRRIAYIRHGSDWWPMSDQDDDQPVFKDVKSDGEGCEPVEVRDSVEIGWLVGE